MRTLALLAVLAAGPASADDTVAGNGFQRLLEMPGHRALIAKIEELDGVPDRFRTDGCSGGLSSSWEVVADFLPDFEAVHEASPPWETCCVVHDRAYHDAGGARTADESFAARLDADEALRACVVEQGKVRRDVLAEIYEVDAARIDAAYAAIGNAMFNAVRFGGGPCSGLPWRWGFGFPGCVPGF